MKIIIKLFFIKIKKNNLGHFCFSFEISFFSTASVENLFHGQIDKQSSHP